MTIPVNATKINPNTTTGFDKMEPPVKAQYIHCKNGFRFYNLTGRGLEVQVYPTPEGKEKGIGTKVVLLEDYSGYRLRGGNPRKNQLVAGSFVQNLPLGEMAFESPQIDDDHIVAVEQALKGFEFGMVGIVPTEYLAFDYLRLDGFNTAIPSPRHKMFKRPIPGNGNKQAFDLTVFQRMGIMLDPKLYLIMESGITVMTYMSTEWVDDVKTFEVKNPDLEYEFLKIGRDGKVWTE